MALPLHLTLTDYVDPTRWRWVLNDSTGRFLADHPVRLDSSSRPYTGFLDLSQYLDYHKPIHPPEAQLADLGSWIGSEVFGGLQTALWDHRASPAVPVHLIIPQPAHELLLRPFELACFTDGTPFRQAGVRFIYQIEGPAVPATPPQAPASTLRILAVFSLPVRANPLNLRRERFGLQRLVRELERTQGLAIQLRILQYGATRHTLQDALEQAEGWDIIHLSGHGGRGELLLEDDAGEADTIDAHELGSLLEPARARLRLLILDACYSGAGSHAAARVHVGLDPTTTTHPGEAEAQALVESDQTTLPNLAQSLAQRLNCATLAMRYPVGDSFATDLMLALYEKLLDRRQPLPAALHLALDDALEAESMHPPLSPLTPILVGAPAANLRLTPPPRPPQQVVLPDTGLAIAFPEEPQRFVGRLQPMRRASQALAPRSPLRGVLFFGMPGAGKTACALELAYRHEQGRFTGFVWYRAPEAGSDIAAELFNFLFEVQAQLNAPHLGLTNALDQPEQFRRFTLPRLRALLEQNSLLLVLDNLETLLSDSNQWRDPLWADLVAILLDHNGPSRTLLTSRRLPANLSGHPRLQIEAIHALSFAESVLLARELPNLKRLFDDEPGLDLLRRTLRVVQGHPKLLELADSLASDREALEERVAAAADDLADRADVLDEFFAPGIPREGETRQADPDFVHALQGWTSGVTAGLSPVAKLLLVFLCRLEAEDRSQDVLDINWKDFLTRLGEAHPIAPAALAEPEHGLPSSLAALQAAGLLAIERPPIDPGQREQLLALLAEMAEQGQQIEGLDPAAVLASLQAQATRYSIHPGVAEAVRAAADPAELEAADIELGDYHIAWYRRGLETELEGGGGQVADSARRSAPYLLRQARWEAAATLLEGMLWRDDSPASLAFALPLLRRIVEATSGSQEGLENLKVLANTLRKSGRIADAETMLRQVVTQTADQGNYRLASSAAGDLVNLLRRQGRLEDALALAEEMAGYTRQAGLGPWTQLADEGYRLQILVAMGHYDQVLEEIDALRPQMEALPLESEAEETIAPWNVREGLLDTGREAANRSQRDEVALALNAEILEITIARGAPQLEVARTRFNDHGPLLALGRYDEARALLMDCRAVFEEERSIQGLGKVYSALAGLEDRTGSRDAAVRFEQLALGYKYQTGEPEDCAISHHNLANYLQRLEAEPPLSLAHRLAAAAICLQIRSGYLATSIRNLANSDLPPAPPPFAEVADRVEAIEGVRFRDLFKHLPATTPDGDAALAAIWQQATEEQRLREENQQEQEALLAALPEPVRAAFGLEGDEFRTALQAAMAEMPDEEAAETLERLQEVGLINPPADSDEDQVPEDFAPLLEAIAAAALNDGLRGEVEPVLATLEEKGWRLVAPAHRIWAGERDAGALTDGLDPQDTAIIQEVLDILETNRRQEALLAALPEPVQAAFDLDGEEFGTALQAALANLPDEEAAGILERLQAAGLINPPAEPEQEQVQVPEDFGPLLQAIAAAVTDTGLRAEVEPVLADLEERGWRLVTPVRRLWAGDRDTGALTDGLDAQDTAIVQEVLDILDANQQQEAVLATMPAPVQAAFDLDGDEFRTALQAALANLPDEEAAGILERLQAAGLIRRPAEPEQEQVPEDFTPLLLAIAAAVTDESLRGEVEPVLAELEEKGWKLVAPARRIWAGERDAGALTDGLDPQDTAIIHRVLELLKN